MLHRSQLNIGLAGAGIGILMTAQAIAAPMITIDGLAGAEHWTWVEAEHATGGTGTASFRDSTTYSGWSTTNSYLQSGSPGNVQLAFTAPANLSSNAHVYLRGTVERRTDTEISVNSIVTDRKWMANSPGAGTGQSLNSVQFLQYDDGSGVYGLSVGAVAQGDHTLQIRRPTTYTAGWRFDGVLIYDGTPVLPTGTEAIATNPANRHWLPNPSSADSPEIAGPVTPTINIAGLGENDRVEYFLNGVSYTPGTEIGVGNHELVVFILDGGSINSDRIAFSGANFRIVPEPGSLGLVGLGAGFILARRRRPA